MRPQRPGAATAPPRPAAGGGEHRAEAALLAGLARRWWRRHPVHAAGRIARPVLTRVALAYPTELVLGSAALGAAVVLLRPWRLLSLGGVAALVFKSSDIADVVNTWLDDGSGSAKPRPARGSSGGDA